MEELKSALKDEHFASFRVIVAYAKSGPLHRLRDLLEEWRSKGKTIEAIIGIDQQGTSREALELALMLFDAVYVTREVGITFHPKIYLFAGESAARAFVGSNNLTVGGTEKNFEAAVQINLDLPTDAVTLAILKQAWADLLPTSCPATEKLDSTILAKLVVDGDVIDEQYMKRGDGVPENTRVAGGRRRPRSGLLVKPESPLPKKALAASSKRKLAAPKKEKPPAGEMPERPTTARPEPSETPTARGLAIQIKPHPNGEIHLSKTAALQNPEFFKWPFTGWATPKKAAKNAPYPQRDPDPVVNITVYGALTGPLLTLTEYRLNTIYYTQRSEIRITASPLKGMVPEYSVMIIERGESPEVDYEIAIHTPDSPDYAAWVAACNQEMPGGGKMPRKYGWF